MQGNGHTIELDSIETAEAVRKWCMGRWGNENPMVWHTVEPGWSVRGQKVHVTNHDRWVLFTMVWT